MKLKGINPLEQHVEKIVVVAVGAVLLGVIAQQFLTQPNEVKVGSETLSPGRAYEPVKKAAQVLKGQLESANPPLEPGFESSGKDMQKEFVRLTSGGIAPRPRIAPLGPSVVLGGGQVKASDAPFAEITLPTPTPAVAASFWATISPEEVAEHPELAALLPKEQPFDRPFVSIESSFDVKALIETLLADPDSGGPIEAMPQGWWRDGIEAVVVEAEREKLNSDGSWASPTTLPGMIGRPLFVMAWNESVKTTSDMQSQIKTAREQSSQVLRPSFYQTLGGQEWSAPSILAARAAANIDPNVIESKKAELAKIQADLAAKKDELAKLPAPEQPKKPEPIKPGEKAPPPAPRAPEAPREPGKPNAPVQNTASIRTRLNNEIRSLENRERTISAEVGRFMPQGALAGDAAAAGASFLSQDSVRFWVHDATASPGEKYRYRVRLGINNPLFGRGMLLKEDQRKLAENSILKSPWSEWSAPVDVDRAEYFFVTSATPDNETSGAARASVELFKFYFGHYRKQTAGMNIGDPLSGEIILGKLAVAPQTPAAPAAPANPAGGRDLDPPPGGPGGAPAAPATPSPATLPFVAPERIRVTLDGVVLLDISSIPVVTGDKPGFIAVLRDIDGNIILRNPENDRDSALYKRMEASAAAAKAGG